MREQVRDQAQSLREIVAQKRAAGVKPDTGNDTAASVLDAPESIQDASKDEERAAAPPVSGTLDKLEVEESLILEEERETEAETDTPPAEDAEPDRDIHADDSGAAEDTAISAEETQPPETTPETIGEDAADSPDEIDPGAAVVEPDEETALDGESSGELVEVVLEPDEMKGNGSITGAIETIETTETIETDEAVETVEPIEKTVEKTIEKTVEEAAAPSTEKDENTAAPRPETPSTPGTKVSVLPVRPRRVRLPLTQSTRVLAVTSGKGGVGKTNITCNVALAMSRMGKKVVVFDADLSLANVDILLGLSPRYNLSHVMRGEKSMKEILVQAAPGFFIVPGVSGLEEFANLPAGMMETLLDDFAAIDNFADIVLIDTAAGINHSVISFLLAADQVVVVTTPEPTAYMDAYALIKVLMGHDREKNLQLIVNMATNETEGREVFKVLSGMTRQWLQAGFDNLGIIPRDVDVLQAVRSNTPVLVHSPHSAAAKRMRHIAAGLLQGKHGRERKSGIRGFMSRVLQHLRKAV